MARLLVSVGVAAWVLVSCAAPGAPPAVAPVPSAAAGSWARAPEPEPTVESRRPCPPARSRVGSEEIGNGAALVLTTTDDFDELRRRAPTFTLSDAPANEIRLDNIHRGIRVIFEAKEPHDLPLLRQRVAEQARQIAADCGATFGASEQRAPAPRPGGSTRAAPTTSTPPSASRHPPAKPSERHPASGTAKPLKPKPKQTPPAHKPAPSPPPPPPPPSRAPRLPVLPGVPPNPLHPDAVLSHSRRRPTASDRRRMR